MITSLVSSPTFLRILSTPLVNRYVVGCRPLPAWFSAGPESVHTTAPKSAGPWHRCFQSSDQFPCGRRGALWPTITSRVSPSQSNQCQGPFARCRRYLPYATAPCGSGTRTRPPGWLWFCPGPPDSSRPSSAPSVVRCSWRMAEPNPDHYIEYGFSVFPMVIPLIKTLLALSQAFSSGIRISPK